MFDPPPQHGVGDQRWYQAYGLSLSSALALPELREGAPHERPDLRIAFGAIPVLSVEGATQCGPFLWVGKDDLVLEVPGVARYRVRSGSEIMIDPAPEIDAGSVRVFLLGSCLGAALMQRGHLVLHGNAVRIGDGSFICLGPSGAGKSTLAAGFMRRGYEVLADDVVALDDDCAVLPGAARVKLWQDAAGKLEIETDGLRRIRPGLEKFDVPLGSFAPAPAPVKWGYLLQNDNAAGFRIERLTGLATFAPLLANTYRARFLDGLGLKARHLAHCGRLAGQIKLARITRPRSGFDLDGLIDAILQDIAKEG